MTTSTTPLSYATHQTTVRPNPDTPVENSTCTSKLDSHWALINDTYYTIFRGAYCRFPHCQETCELNGASLVFPTSQENLENIISLISPLGETVFLGIYLPLFRDTSTVCQKKDCETYLQLANTTKYLWHPWHQNLFDRHPRQPKCYTIQSDQSQPRPTKCGEFHTALCQSTCPRAGPRWEPQPENVQKDEPLDETFARIRRSDLYNSSGNPSPTTPPSAQSNLNFGAPRVSNPFDLVGYDCSRPKGITPVRMAQGTEPCGLLAEPREQRNASFTLLQKSNRVNIPVQRCSITESVIAYHCGQGHHSSIHPDWFKFNDPVSVSSATCRELWTTLTWRDPSGIDHTLLPNTTTKVPFYVTGYVYEDDYGPCCQGGIYKRDGKTYYGIVVKTTRQITLEAYDGRVDDDGEIFLPQLDLTMPCIMRQRQCRTRNFGTFVWNPLTTKDSCTYFRTRTTKGIIISDTDDRETYISTDKSMLRLIIGKPQSKCGAILLHTNYEKLYLTEDGRNYPENLHGSEFSLPTYVNQQDGYLYGRLTKNVREEFAKVHYENCRRRSRQEHFNYDRLMAEQGTTDGDTATLGGGFYLTMAGEAYYRYQCRRTVVRARSTTKCYATLPVDLSAIDRTKYQEDREQQNTTMEFFLEPKTRIITTRGIELPCQETFAPLYASIKGPWIKANPTLANTNTPELLDIPKFRANHKEEEENLDFEEGGIYTAKQVLKYEQQREIARAVKDVQYTMGQQAQNIGWNSGNNNRNFLFSPERVILGLRNFTLIGAIWDFLSMWGNFVSTIMGIYFIGKFVWWIYGCIFSMAWPPRTESASDRLHTGLTHKKLSRYRRRNNSDSDQYESIQSQPPKKNRRRWYRWRKPTEEAVYQSATELRQKPTAPRYTSRPANMTIPPPGIEFHAYHNAQNFQEGVTWNKLEEKSLTPSRDLEDEEKQRLLLASIGNLQASLSGFFAANPTVAAACENTFNNIKRLRSVLLSKGLTPAELAEVNSKLEKEKEALRNLSMGALPEDVC